MSSSIQGSPSLAHRSQRPLSPHRTLGSDACQTSPNSVPPSPNRHPYRIIAGYGYSSYTESARVDKTFSNDATLNGSMRDQDDGDPHDLSFPTKHFPRASMVDNLAMSLDQFSPATDTLRNSGPHQGLGRQKGHNKSSSVTTASELRTQPIREAPIVEIHSTKDGSQVEEAAQIPNIFGDEEESKREKAYNAQRAMQTTKATSNRTKPRTKSRSNSNSSSIDLGHLATYAGRLGHAGNRRSQSFDYGSTRQKPTIDPSDMTHSHVIYRGVETTSTTTTATSEGQEIARRNSGRSAGGGHNRKGRSGTITTANSRPRLESPQPQLATKSQTFDAADGKNVGSSQTDQYYPSRTGFFRRVFGSSNRSTMGPSSYPSPARQSQDPMGSTIDLPGTSPVKILKQGTADLSHNKENQPIIAKKSSSFFRRRKKSISGGVPPPLPLTLNGNLDATKAEGGGSSPVSSLRAFMDPYLADGTPKHTRGSSLQSVQRVDDVGLTSKTLSSDDRTHTDGRPGGHGVTTQKQNYNIKGPIHSVSAAKNTVSNDRGGTTANEKLRDGSLAPNLSVRQTTTTPASPSAKKAELVVLSKLDATSSTSNQCQTDPDKSEEPRRNDSSPTKLRPFGTLPVQDLSAPPKTIKLVPQSSGSDTSDYKSAPSTPLVSDIPNRVPTKSPAVHVSHPSMSQKSTHDDIERARKIYDNSDEQVDFCNASAWLGEASSERGRIRIAYMSLFDWTDFSILAALRNLCSKLVLKGETQQVDRVLEAFSQRWCECNNNHGFKSADIVHTICYSILLLNTDLHLADIGRKMTRAEFVRNAMDTIRENMTALGIDQTEQTNLLNVRSNNRTNPASSLRPSVDRSTSSLSNTRPTEHLSREESYDESISNVSGRLVEAPFSGSRGGWELQIEAVLKDFYSSISREPLPLFGSQQVTKSNTQQSTNNLSALSTLRRTPSTISKATSENRGRYINESRSLGARWTSKTRSRPRLATSQAFGSSRTSIDDQSSAWSPSMSSTWSKASWGKTLTSMSVESFGTDYVGGGYQSSIGFANALSQAIIRDEQLDSHTDDGVKAAPLLEDETLELYGAPWAKEGILKHKCHLEGVDKRSKDRNWNDYFAVIEKGWMRLFSFSMTAKSLRNKARNHKAGAVVGGGNWQDNAEEVWKFMLRHTIASSLPPPGYSKQRPYVWALSLPNGAVHLFSVGTPDIVKEFVSTANFWSARLSKEPMTGGISSMEYGWSENVVNRALGNSEGHPSFNTSSPRPSTQLSMRSSIDHGNVRPRLPGDKVHVSEWVQPQQSLMASQLLEIDQLKALQVYVKNIEDELQKHNELRGPMLLAFSARHPNSSKAMGNWEKKSSYLLREIVKFRTYIDALQCAQTTKQKVDRMKKEHEMGRGLGIEKHGHPVELA